MPTISSIFKINIKFPKSQLAFPTLILKMPTVMLEIPTYILEVKNFNLLQHLKSFRPKINLNLLDSLSLHTPPPPHFVKRDINPTFYNLLRCELVLMTYLILHPRRNMRLAVAWIDGTRLHFVKILTSGDVNTFFALPERPEKLIIRITIITILLLCIFEPGCPLFLYFWIHYLFLI